MSALTVAPMEGLTGVVFRQVHHRFFGGADAYYIPFVTPTVEPKFTERQLRELAPEVNAGFNAIPQLLSNRSADFIWAAKVLHELGYSEVNLNLGCPAGTVVAKGKGSGFLRDLYKLERFLDEIFSADLPIPVSVKTRLGWCQEEEFDDIFALYRQFPIARLIVHMRLKTDQYRGDVRKAPLLKHLDQIPFPLGVNGDIVTVEDLRRTESEFGKPEELMVGRALIADPALFRKAKGGKSASREEIARFSSELFDAYTQAFQSRKNAMMRMKEYWFFQRCLFEDNANAFKKAVKSRDEADFTAAIDEIIEGPLLPDARFGWHKPI